jgi:hypothetical protein
MMMARVMMFPVVTCGPNSTTLVLLMVNGDRLMIVSVINEFWCLVL